MKINKGMYIRFNGFISKIGHINTSKKGNTYVQFKQPNGLLAHTRIENIDRASFNIIDLIEVGDVLEINNEKYEVIYDESYEKLGILIPNRKQLAISHSALEFVLKKYKISIVTKEQFNSMKYVVERNTNENL